MIDSCQSCGAPIVRALSATRRRPISVDAYPSKKGNILLSTDLFGDTIATAYGEARENGRLNHFASCPDAKHWRSKL